VLEHTLFYTDQLKAIQEEPAGYAAVNIEARFSRVRTQETNLGNMMADLIRSEYNADFGLSNGGSLRANCVIQKGMLRNGFIGQVLPGTDTVQNLRVTGKVMHQILENGLSMYPKYDGRWPVVSGMKFKFDPEQPVGSRVILDSFV
jgi:5'-nucleotidase